MPLFLPTATETDSSQPDLISDSGASGLGAARRETEVWLQTLHLYGAAGIAAFGWAMCRLIGASAKPWLPMWFCSALLLYNVDRLRRDPSDGMNTPLREEAARRLRPWSWALTAVSTAVLFLVPIRRRDWLTLSLTLGGSIVCLNYSVPVRGFRLKDVPLLKTFFAPTLVIAAVFGLPVLHSLSLVDIKTPILVLWAWSILFSNMVLCDLRDVPGDQSCGVVSVPSHIGPKWTGRLLWMLIALTGGLGLLLAHLRPMPSYLWLRLTLASAAYLTALVVAVRKPRSERFYEWCVEGVLFVPAIVLLF